MKRCFVALAPAEKTRHALVELQDSLRHLPADAARRVRVVSRDNLHLTVKFLGATADEQVSLLQERLGALAAAFSLPAVSLTGVGAFPTIDRPRAVYAAVREGQAEVADLCARIDSCCSELGFPHEELSRVPHVTLARVEGAMPKGPLCTWLRETPARTWGPIETSHLYIYESQLAAGGSVYRRLAALELLAP